MALPYVRMHTLGTGCTITEPRLARRSPAVAGKMTSSCALGACFLREPQVCVCVCVCVCTCD